MQKNFSQAFTVSQDMWKQAVKENKLQICYGTTNPELGKKILGLIDCPEIEVKLITKKFADGEICTEYDRSIRGCDLYIIQSVCRPNVNSALMELILAIDAAKRASVKRITAIIPYYGYARQDRKAKMRQPISARVVADMLTNAGVNHVVTVDIHATQIQGFFPATVPLDFLLGDLVFLEKLTKLVQQKPCVIASADAGGASRCRQLAMRLKLDLVIVDKRRYADNQAEVMNVIGDVKNKNVIIYDDICDTAGSLCNAAEALLKAGASEVYGAVTHPVLSGPACERIQKSAFKKVYFSDSIPCSAEQLEQMGKVDIISCSQVLLNTIQLIHFNQSLSDLCQHMQSMVDKSLQ